MLKQYKKTIILTSLITLFPILAGLLLWNRLPEMLTTHWGFDGQADGWSSLSFAVFFLPSLLLLFHWFCLWFTAKDPGNHGQNKKMFYIVLWIVPILSNVCSGIMYAVALGWEASIAPIMMLLFSFLFMIIGNYMPKCTMNSTMGIKLPWTYSSEANWNATHRFGGKLWVAGGALMLPLSLLPDMWGFMAMFMILLPMVLIPTIYSYRFYKQEQREGKELLPLWGGMDTRMTKGSLVAVALILAAVAVLMVTGDIQVVWGETSFTIEASYHEDLTVAYEAIDSIEYRDHNISGMRTMGFSSARLLLGLFENDEFGSYTRYTYTDPDAGIVIYSGSKVLVLSGKDAAETQEIYQQLVQRTGK